MASVSVAVPVPPALAALKVTLEVPAAVGVPEIRPLEESTERPVGKPVALSTIYRMLARHGWRKLAPDTEHPQGDAQAREDWKKNSPIRWQKR